LFFLLYTSSQFKFTSCYLLTQGLPGSAGLPGLQGEQLPPTIGPKGDKGEAGDVGPPGRLPDIDVSCEYYFNHLIEVF
jgi:hypothetical protein